MVRRDADSFVASRSELQKDPHPQWKRDGEARSTYQPLLHQNQIAALPTQLCLDIFVQTGVADDGVNL